MQAAREKNEVQREVAEQKKRIKRKFSSRKFWIFPVKNKKICAIKSEMKKKTALRVKDKSKGSLLKTENRRISNFLKMVCKFFII